MSTSLLYHAFGIRGYQYIRTDYQGGEVFFTITQNLQTRRCSACGAGAVRPRGQVERRFRAQPIGSRWTTIVIAEPDDHGHGGFDAARIAPAADAA